MYSEFDKKVCTELHYNYQQAVSDGREIFGEDWLKAKVGERGVIQIHEHTAQGEGDRHYFDIIKDDNTVERTFNQCRAFYITNTKPETTP